MSLATLFDAAYVASKDPRIQALFAGTMGLPGTMLDPIARENLAYNLAVSGLIIDVPIDAQGGDPYIIMQQRQQYGYTWVPSALAASIPLAPGLTFPGIPSYNANPPYPPGSIVVSTNIADYPPFPVPAPTPAPTVPLVGAYLGNGYYATSMAAQKQFANGETYTDPATGTKYTFVVGSMGAFGATYFWKLAPTS